MVALCGSRTVSDRRTPTSTSVYSSNDRFASDRSSSITLRLPVVDAGKIVLVFCDHISAALLHRSNDRCDASLFIEIGGNSR